MQSRSGIFWIALGVLVGNVLDAMFTIIYTDLGVAQEANPLLGPALEDSPLLFMVIKLGLVSMGVTLLWRLRHRRAAVAGLIAAAATYSWLLGYHLSGVPHLVAVAS